MPLISVIVPTYNRPELLRRAISSVNNQTYSNIELIVVDDCSNEPTKDVVTEAPTHLIAKTQHIRHKRNKGANAARNTGIKASTGEFIAFLDDDDEWEKTKLSRQVEAYNKSSTEIGVVYTGERYVDETGTTTRVKTPETSGRVTRDLLEGKPLSPFSAVMVHTELIKQVGILDERFPSWQDRDWYVRLSLQCEFLPITEPLVIRHTAHDNRIGKTFETKRDVSFPLFLRKHRSLALEYGPDCERKFIASMSRTLGIDALGNEYYSDARHYLLSAIRMDPFQIKSYPYLFAAIGGRLTHKLGCSLTALYRTCKR